MQPLKVRKGRQVAYARQLIEAGNEAVGAWLRLGFLAERQHVSAADALTVAGRPEVLERLVLAGLLWPRENREDGFEVLPQSRVA